MIQTDKHLVGAEAYPTQHAMLIAWGHFARTIGLLERVSKVPIAQKTVTHRPHEKVLELLIGLLSGIEYLSDLSEGAAPLVHDAEVARAWHLQALADASGVSRTLRACTEQSVEHLQAALDRVSQPFLARAVAELRQHHDTIVLDAELTGRPVSSTSHTFPDAAFGYRDGEVRLGYQLAEICMQTRRYGRQWLSAQHHPGDTVSAPCLLELIEAAEHRLGGHPRRRPEGVRGRIDHCDQRIAKWGHLAAQKEQQVALQTQRLSRLSAQLQRAQEQLQRLPNPITTSPAGPTSKRSRLNQQIARWQRHCQRAQSIRAQATEVAQRHRERERQFITERDRLQARYARLCRDNVAQAQPLRCKVRIDAGFCSSENVTELIELGYDVETKSANPALGRALRQQADTQPAWQGVGKNAEMMACTPYHFHTCPYPLTVGLQRFHTPKGVLHAVLIRYPAQDQTMAPDLKDWFDDYHARQTIEAGNKEEKTTFKVQHLMSRSPAGIRIQALLTVFAANFVRWADEWIRPQVEHSSKRFDRVLSSPKRLLRVAANSPASIDYADDQVLIRFSPLSSFGGVVIRLPNTPQYRATLPAAANDHFLSV